MTDERKTDPTGLRPSKHPCEMTDRELLEASLHALRDLQTRVGTLERESSETRKCQDEQSETLRAVSTDVALIRSEAQRHGKRLSEIELKCRGPHLPPEDEPLLLSLVPPKAEAL